MKINTNFKDFIYSHFYIDKKIFRYENPIKAYLYYLDFRFDLLTGKKEKININLFFNSLDSLKIYSRYDNPIVIHLFYELSYKLFDIQNKNIKHAPLALYIEYSKFRIENFPNTQRINLTPTKLPTNQDYLSKFNKVKFHLNEGDCYQLNLTNNFHFKFVDQNDLDEKIILENFWSKKENLSVNAHSTVISPLKKIFISNSPECLFNITKNKIQTFPIKGTKGLESKDKKELQRAYLNLRNDLKNISELNIITDLMRNDLTSINLNPSKVLKICAPLFVPRLVHLYSIIETNLERETSLLKIIKSMFPGGSISGAPKKNVLKLILDIEDAHRGFYTGTTILLHKNIRSGSINIRSCEISLDENEIIYGGGGGITLLSEKEDEYKEAFKKMESFINVFFQLEF